MWQALVQYSCAWLAGWLAARPINGGFLHFIFLSSVHALPVQLEWKPKFDNNGPYSHSSPPRCHCLVNVTSLLHSLHATQMSVSRLLLLAPMCTYSWLVVAIPVAKTTMQQASVLQSVVCRLILILNCIQATLQVLACHIYLVEVNIVSTVLWKARDYTSGRFSNILIVRHCPQNLQ